MKTTTFATIAAALLLTACSEGTAPEDESCTTSTGVALQPGQKLTITSRKQLACFHLQSGVANLEVLLMPQNVSSDGGATTPFELAGVLGTPVVASVQPAFSKRSLTTTPHHDFELRIRRAERELLNAPAPTGLPQYSRSGAAACPTPVAIGNLCEFMVFNKDEEFERVTAVVKAITTHAIVYQDINTPASGALTDPQFNELGAFFDDPIYETDVELFGQPSDSDNNGKIYILLTPVVNALTPRGGGGFIAGFFYGCDLLSKSQCSGTNGAEIFYAVTTDPNGQFGDARSAGTVIQSLPAVLAHEFQHMINFAQRNKTQDELWLAEGLAHHAEDAVADVFAARGEAGLAAQFRAQNTTRANRYLRSIETVSLIDGEDAGSLEVRGAAWLFVKYLTEQHGNEILAKLTRGTQKGVSNVTTQTGKTWSTLMSEWGVALWADDAPGLSSIALPKELTYPSVNLRQRFRNGDNTYPLKPAVYSFVDFVEDGTLLASSQSYSIVKAGAASQQAMNLRLTGGAGGAFGANAVPQVTVLRIQ